jgi:hypothetical protein
MTGETRFSRAFAFHAAVDWMSFGYREIRECGLRHTNDPQGNYALVRKLLVEPRTGRELTEMRRLLGHGAGGADGTSLLETFPAIDGTSLRGPKGNRSLLTTLRADRFSFYSLKRTGRRRALSPGRLAGLTAFGLVLKPLIGEEHLLA